MNLNVIDANPANRIAKELTGRDYLSHSQITTYQACPLKWYFAYVAGIPPEFVASSLVFGSAIHTAIEQHNRSMLTGDPRPSVDDLLAVFDSGWKESATAPVKFPNGDSADSLRDLGGRVLSAFAASSAAEPDGTVLAIEEKLRAQIVPGVPDMLAIVDLIVLKDDALIVRDLKTSKSSWTQSKVTESAPQLLLYAELASDLAGAFGGVPVRLEFTVLTKHKNPRIESHVVDSDAAQLARTKRIVKRVWDAMKAGHVFPNPSPLNCSTCPHQNACRVWCG